MKVIKGPMNLMTEDKLYSLDLESSAPKGSGEIDAYPCSIIWKQEATGVTRVFGVYPSFSIAIWVLFRIESFFPNGSSMDVPRFLRGAKQICKGYETLGKHIEMPKVRFSKAAATHADMYIESEGLRNFSHRLMLNGKITVIYPGGGDSVHLSTGYLYCQKTYDDDGNVTDYHVRFRSY